MKTSNQNQNVTTIKTHLNELDPIKTHPKITGLRGMDFFLIHPYLSLSPFASSVVQKTELTIMGPPLVLEALEFYNIIISINFKTSRTSGDTESTQQSNHMSQKLQYYHPKLQRSVELVKHHFNPSVPATSKSQRMMVVQHHSMEYHSN